MKILKKDKKYKNLLRLKRYDSKLLINYLLKKYTCKDITKEFTNSILYDEYLSEARRYRKKNSFIKPVVLAIEKDKKSSNLYAEGYFDSIFVFIDNETGFVSSNNDDLKYELIIEKGISNKDVTAESKLFHDTLSFLSIYNSGCQ